MDSSFSFVEIAKCQQSIAHRISPGHKSILRQTVEGDLQVFIEASCAMLVLQLDTLMFGINSDDQIVYDSDPDFKLVFYLNSDCDHSWIFKVNKNEELLCAILAEKCKFIDAKEIENDACAEHEIAHEKQGGFADEDPKNYEKRPEIIDRQLNPTSTQMKLIKASEKVGGVLKKVGTLLKGTAVFLGEKLANRIEPADPIQFSQTSTMLATKSVQASGKVLKLTEEQVAKLFRIGLNQIKSMDNRFSTQQQKDNYDSLKHNVKTGLTVAYNIYDEYTEGVGSIIEGLAEGSKTVVEKKYGEDAAKMTKNMVQSARNVYKVTKVPKDQAKKLLKPSSESPAEQ